MKTRKTTTLMLIAVLLVAGNLTAQSLRQDDEVQALVMKSLPSWDEGVLERLAGGGGQDWTREVDSTRVFEVMGDRPARFEKVPDQARRFETETAVVKLDRGRGRIRYLNRERAWSFDKHASTAAVAESRAHELVLRTVEKLGLPPQEMAEPRIDTQVAGGGPVGTKELQDRFEMYRIVSIPRTLGDLPVLGSGVRAAVSNEGQIQRLKVQWPALRPAAELRLLPRDQVVDRITRQILEQQPQGELEIVSFLAYAPVTTDDEEVFFGPAVVVSVYSLPTPYQLVVPVAESGGRKDG